MNYNHLEVEKKWRKKYEESDVFFCDTSDFSKPKYYVLDMFPYPSGSGIHVGHAEGYTATDIVARMKRLQGFNVLHPMGWDAFGLPAEQYAIQNNVHPENFTRSNIDNFRAQLKLLGFTYDWSKEYATCDPSYYKWTQWIFLKLLEHKLAFVSEVPVNFCPELGTVLSNEEVVDGKSERGGYPVIRMPMKQWILKITEYAERLLEPMDSMNWPKSTLEMQKNWIGKSKGVNITFSVAERNETFTVFTTRVDTLYGCTYVVLAPEHSLVNILVSEEQKEKVEEFKNLIQSKSDMERTELNKDKSGVFIGAYAINPINDKKVPIFIGDYVLGSYGSGAVMAVPAHDQRDYEFAKKYNLEIIQVLEGDVSKEAMVEDAIHINSDIANGLNIEKAKVKITEKLVQINKGKEVTNYKLRDWLFSRQRYWGEPIPVVHYKDGTYKSINVDALPLVLPKLEKYAPSGTTQSPLVHAKDWLNVKINGEDVERETNTMPQWAGSCWFFIRYIDPKNDHEIADKKLLAHWLPVDLYIGGSEHAVLHLLYARFWYKFLFDIGLVPNDEPFKKMFHQGMILGENKEKMSKSRGNVVNPDDIVEKYGADSLRLYLMFMGPLEASLPWSSSGLEGVKKFIDRVYRIMIDENYIVKHTDVNDGKLDYVYNMTVKKVTNDFENLQFNTAISQMMIFINELYLADKIYKPYLLNFIKMFSCICPFVSEEMYQKMTKNEFVDYETWPTYDDAKTVLSTVRIAVSVNGKLRSTIDVDASIESEELQKLALDDENVKRHIADKQIKKVIVVKGKIVNIVCV